MNPMGLFFVFAGLFSVAGGVCNWDWFMNHHKAQFMSSLLGRNGARVFYMILGLGLAVFGALYAAGIIQDSPR